MFFELRIEKYDPLFNDKPSDLYVARAHIIIDDSCLIENDNGTIVLSAECRNPAEVEEYADQMIAELDKLKRKARVINWHGSVPKQARE